MYNHTSDIDNKNANHLTRKNKHFDKNEKIEKNEKNEKNEKEKKEKKEKNSSKTNNLFKLKKKGFKYNITDIITDLMKLNYWKFNQKKLNPLKNKLNRNLNYLQKSQKNLNIKHLKNTNRSLLTDTNTTTTTTSINKSFINKKKLSK
jgi:hypothetical protein